MNRLKLAFFIVAVSASVISAFAITDSLVKINKTMEETRIIKGEISVFDYCSHIGKAAAGDAKCNDFNRFFGPQ